MARLHYVVTDGVTAEKLLVGQLRALVERGHDVTVTAAPGPRLDAAARREGVRCLPVGMQREINPAADLRALLALVRLFRAERPDVVHASTPKAGLLATTAARLARVPGRVYLVRGLRLETTAGRARAVLRVTERAAAASATRVVAVSPSLARRLEDDGLVRRGQAEVLGAGSSNGVDAGRFAGHDRASVRASLGLPGDVPVVGFVGRFTRDKGVAEIVDALGLLRARRPDVHLLLVGDHEPGDPVPDDVRAALDADPRAVRPGFVDDVGPLYAAMDVLAFPSHREGFPNVPLEAAAAGVPVVASRATGCVDGVVDGVTGTLADVGDAPGLAAALARYLDDPALARAHGAAGRERVVRDFAPARVREATARLLETEARRGGLRRPTDRLTRAADVVGSGVGLVVLSPVLAAVAGAVRLRLGRPVLFRQVRPGLLGRPFPLLKFRTMTEERGPDGALLPDERRLTGLGRALRSTSLDELPELLNVLRGDMAVVGPRPWLTAYLDRYTPEQARRHDVRPGITGLAQVSGRNRLDWEGRLAADVRWVDERSPRLWLSVLLRTVGSVARRTGIAEEGHGTSSEFPGLPSSRGTEV